MSEKTSLKQRGFTITELMVTVAALVIAMLCIGTVLADSHRAWQRAYNRANSDVVTGGYKARRVFDALIRKASKDDIWLDEDGNWVEVHYYQDAGSAVPDRYACIAEIKGGLSVEYGQLDPRETLRVWQICPNVSGCHFSRFGSAVQMVLTIDDGSQTNTVASSAVMHN